MSDIDWKARALQAEKERDEAGDLALQTVGEAGAKILEVVEEKEALASRLAVVTEALGRISILHRGDDLDSVKTATGRLNAAIDIAQAALSQPHPGIDHD